MEVIRQELIHPRSGRAWGIKSAHLITSPNSNAQWVYTSTDNKMYCDFAQSPTRAVSIMHLVRVFTRSLSDIEKEVFRNSGRYLDYDIKDYSFVEAEYLPSSLSPKAWADTKGSAHKAYDVDALLSYVKPYDSIADLEKKNAQLEQELGVVRGGVQGVKLPFNGIVSTCKSAILNVDISLRELPNTGDGYKIYLSDNYYQYPNDVSMLIDVLNEDGVLAVYMSIGAYINGVWSRTKVARLVVQNVKHIGLSSCGIISINGYVHNIVIAGLTVKDMTTLCVQSRSLNTPNAIYYNIRTFNTGINAQQFDDLYNQGRCDEVRLGGEYYILADKFTLSTSGKNLTNATLKNGKQYFNQKPNTNYFDEIYGINAEGFFGKNMKKGIFLITIKGGAKDGVVGKIRVAYDGTLASEPSFDISSIFEKTLIIDTTKTSNSDGMYLIPSTIGGHSPDITYVQDGLWIDEIIVDRVQLLNEYLPSYLTQTKWISTGVNRQDITYTDPTFTYIKPYKDYQSGVAAPTIPPNAMGEVFYDSVLKRKYECYGKLNTEQYTVNHWITK